MKTYFYRLYRNIAVWMADRIREARYQKAQAVTLDVHNSTHTFGGKHG